MFVGHSLSLNHSAISELKSIKKQELKGLGGIGSKRYKEKFQEILNTAKANNEFKLCEETAAQKKDLTKSKIEEDINSLMNKKFYIKDETIRNDLRKMLLKELDNATLNLIARCGAPSLVFSFFNPMNDKEKSNLRPSVFTSLPDELKPMIDEFGGKLQSALKKHYDNLRKTRQQQQQQQQLQQLQQQQQQI